MLNKKIAKGAICVGVVFAVALTMDTHSVSSTTMGRETELAGMSFALDEYCNKQVSSGNNNPEAVVAFAATNTQNAELTQDEINSINSGIVPDTTQTATSTTPVPTSTPQPTVKPKSEYENIGVSVAEGYVRVREKADTTSKVVGKLYRGSAAKIVERQGDWVKIRSGKVTGYIKKDFLAIGFSVERLVGEFGTKYATVTTQTLKVREAKNPDCKILTLVPEGETYRVVRDDKEWAKIEVDDGTKGFVSKDYVKVSVRFKQAVSIEEEEAEARRKAAADTAADENPVRTTSSSNRHSSSRSSNRHSSSRSSSHRTTVSEPDSNNSASGSGGSVVSYAKNFLGNRYVWGGTSLKTGADCSGFVQSIFRKFGVSLPRSSREQATVGTRVSLSSARPGDLVFYAKEGRPVHHVAIYMGGGRVIHSKDSNSGVVTSNVGYGSIYCIRRVL